MSLLPGEGMLSYSDVRELGRATIAKTLKAVAEWLGEFCNNGKHQTPASRLHCVFCMVDFYDAASEGKIPGEEK